MLIFTNSLLPAVSALIHILHVKFQDPPIARCHVASDVAKTAWNAYDARQVKEFSVIGLPSSLPPAKGRPTTAAALLLYLALAPRL